MIDDFTTEGALVRPQPGGAAQCLACAHACVIPDGGRGKCGVRHNRGGVLRVPYGYISGAACDPVEKKPFFHVAPGSGAFSFGMLGCNFTCSFCQNYHISQNIKDNSEPPDISPVSAGDIAAAAKKCRARLLVSTYNEPLITAEWAKTVFARAKCDGLLCAYVSNGFATEQALEFIRPVIDAYKVDLKCFDETKYRKVAGGSLRPVLDTISWLNRNGVWVEVVTLVIPGFNDGDAELGKIAGFIASVSPDIPWHVTAFHPDFKMAEAEPTPLSALERAAEAGEKAGLRYVYAGNSPGNSRENTVCPSCKTIAIERHGYAVKNYLDKHGACPKCRAKIPGLWVPSGTF